MTKQFLDDWNLDIGDCLVIGIWKLVIFLGPLDEGYEKKETSVYS